MSSGAKKTCCEVCDWFPKRGFGYLLCGSPPQACLRVREREPERECVCVCVSRAVLFLLLVLPEAHLYGKRRSTRIPERQRWQGAFCIMFSPWLAASTDGHVQKHQMMQMTSKVPMETDVEFSLVGTFRPCLLCVQLQI